MIKFSARKRYMLYVPPILLAAALGAYFWPNSSINATKNSADHPPEIPCDQSAWEHRRDFDATAWKAGRDREKFAEQLVQTLVGKTREEVESQLGTPYNDAKSQPYSYQYLLGKFDYFRCNTAISQWLIVGFGNDSKVRKVTLRREH